MYTPIGGLAGTQRNDHDSLFGLVRGLYSSMVPACAQQECRVSVETFIMEHHFVLKLR
jgi:hypothetical protein